jgi:hypothetical protein
MSYLSKFEQNDRQYPFNTEFDLAPFNVWEVHKGQVFFP